MDNNIMDKIVITKISQKYYPNFRCDKCKNKSKYFYCILFCDKDMNSNILCQNCFLLEKLNLYKLCNNIFWAN